MKILITSNRYVPYINKRVADTKTQKNMNINTAAKLSHHIFSSAMFNTKVQCLYNEVFRNSESLNLSGRKALL